MELPYSQDMLDFLATLNRWEVQYLIVGGRAVNAYTEARGTKDLDIWTNPTLENAKRVYAALIEFGAPLFGATEETFTRKDEFLFIGVAPNRIDLLKDIPGVEFDDCWEKRQVFDLGNGLEVNYLGLPDLITAKLAAGRHIDLADVDNLKVALERKQTEELAAKSKKREPQQSTGQKPPSSKRQRKHPRKREK